LVVLAVCSAALAADDNLISNGRFDPFSGWITLGDRSAIRFDAESQSVCIDARSKPVDLRQVNIELSPDRRYQLSCKVKSEGGDDAHGGVTIINNGWLWAAPFLRPQEATSDWTDLKAEITLKPSSNGKYQLVICGMTKGRLFAKDIGLKPVVDSPAAAAGFAPSKPVDYFWNQNLITNGRFEVGNEFPEAWTPYEFRAFVYDKTGGRNARPCLGIRGAARGASARQFGLILVPGETYKLSGYLRTKDFTGPDGKTANGGVAVINAGWQQSSDIRPGAADSDWKYYEVVFKAPSSTSGDYGIAIYTAGARGEIAVCDVRLQAKQHSIGGYAMEEFYRVIPIKPFPSAIPADQPRLQLSYPYLADADESAYTCRVSLRSTGKGQARTSPAREYPIRDGQIEVDLASLGVGPGEMDAAIVEKAGDRAVCTTQIPLRIVNPKPLDMSKVRPLNTLVSELFAAGMKIAPAAAAQCRFTNPRDGWVFVAANPTSAADGIRLCLPDPKSVVARQAEGQTGPIETMRWLPSGEHCLQVQADREVTAQIVVRSVPELIFDGPNYHSAVDPNGKYNWAFMEKHVLPVCNVFLRGRLTPEEYQKAHARGMRWLESASVPGIYRGRFDEGGFVSPEELAAKLAAQPGFRDANHDGTSLDEFLTSYCSPALFADYARAFDKLYQTVPAEKSLYAWVSCGPPPARIYFSDFFASLFRHGGQCMFEAYGETRPTEAEAAAYLDDFFVGTLKAYKRCLPDAQRHMIYGIGIHANMLDITQFAHPQVDPKYFLDMQLNLIANHPEFQGLYGLCTYTSGHADEETVRWMGQLLRHYALEGRRDMLSAEYGLRYLPGHLANGDFDQGTEGWTCAAAEQGSLYAGYHKGYGKLQKRWTLGGQLLGAGDHFLVMKHSEKGPNRISHPVKNLLPGKLYALQFVVADLANLPVAKTPTVQYPLRALLDDVQVVPDSSYVYLDKRRVACGANLQTIVFRANSSSSTLTLSDWASDRDAGGPAGQELIVNFVRLKPYLPDR
jgi:hypothetical protein